MDKSGNMRYNSILSYFTSRFRRSTAMKIYKYTVGTMGTNCYIIDGGSGKCAVVDPGADIEKITSAVESKGLTVEKIILTHAHFDHMLALEELRRLTGAPLLIYKDEAGLLADCNKNLLHRYADVAVPPEPAEVLLSDGDVITVGDGRLTVMHTPGHTPGSMCLVTGDTVISGDTLFRESIGRYDFPGGDYGTIMKSLDKFKALEGDYKILPGHGPSTTLSHEKEYNLYLQ